MQYADRARGWREEGAEIRAWRLTQRLPSGRHMRIGDLARLARTSEEVVGRFERGERAAGRSVRSRIWALVLASRTDAALELKPLVKCAEGREPASEGPQLLLWAFG